MRPGRKKVHPRDKPGWKPNPFGKYMGQSSAKKYLEATKHCYARVTQEARVRRLRMSAPVEAVSQVMGHSTTKTTESYYGRMRDSHAFSLVENAWAQKPIASIEPAIREKPCQSRPVQKKPELNFSQ